MNFKRAYSRMCFWGRQVERSFEKKIERICDVARNILRPVGPPNWFFSVCLFPKPIMI